MSVAGLVAGDLLLSAGAAAGWLGAGTAAAARRGRLSLALLAVAVVLSLGRVGSVILLADAGWWFVQEKATLAVPLLVVAGLAATVFAGPRLTAGLRAGNGAGTRAGEPARPAVIVALLTAGYAAAAGPVVTLLCGYPVTWSTGLITLAVVGGAAIVTWRLLVAGVSVPGRRAAAVATMLIGLAGLGLAFLPVADASQSDTQDPLGLDHAGHSLAGPGTAVTSLRGPSTPAAGGAVRRFTLTARKATVTLASGRRVQAWTFDGQVPGPSIAVVEGDLVEVTLRNADIAEGVTLHWHGYDVPAGEDGVPGLTQEAVSPGQEFVYRFRATRTGTYWHHTHEVSDRGVKLGLYGAVVVTARGAPTTGVDLTLPVHTLGGSTVLGDNDGLYSRQVSPGTPVRLRLINPDNVPRTLALSGSPFRVVAVDGTDLNGPGELDRVGLRVPAGARYDLAFTMPSGPVALLAANDRAGGLRLLPNGVAAVPADDTASWPTLDLLRYGDHADVPYGVDSQFDQRFTLVLDRGLALDGLRPSYAYTVNGHAFPNIPTEVVREGDLVEFTVVNRSRDTHPWHLHGHRVRVLARDGQAPTGSPLWLDTFDVRPGEVWRVAFRADNPGLWMNHCHNFSHADQGMSLHLAYGGITTPFQGAHGG